MNYPVVLHKDPQSDFGVTVPDLPGCFSAGSTIDEALTMAKEAIELHLEGLVEDGQAIPAPGVIEEHQRNVDFRCGTGRAASPRVQRSMKHLRWLRKPSSWTWKGWWKMGRRFPRRERLKSISATSTFAAGRGPS